MHIKDVPLRPEERMTSSFSSSSEDIDLNWLVRVLNRRKWAILLPALLAALLAVLILSQVPSTYDGYAEVLIDTRDTKVVDVEAVLADMLPDAESLESQVRVLQSRNLAYKVVQALDLEADPEFNDALVPPGILKQATTWIRDRLRDVGVLSRPKPLTPEQQAEQERAEVVDNFLDNLSVELMTKSRVIGITFTSENPERAAQVVNKIAELYIIEELDAKYEATRRATQWLTDKIADLRRSVASSEQAVEKFRSQAGLLQGTGGTLIAQQISDLNTQLIVVRTARAEAEARLTQARQAARSPDGVAAAGDVLKSPIVQQLVDQETQVKRKVAELVDEFGDRHPRMISARAELADVQAKLQREINKVVGALENEVGVARAREQALERNLDQLKTRLAQSNTAEVQLRALERDADASRALLESFLG
jgi:succinoglycan biosynthesis transport protein ExoP